MEKLMDVLQGTRSNFDFKFFLLPSLLNSSLKCFAKMITFLLGVQFSRLTNSIHSASKSDSSYRNDKAIYFLRSTIIT